jgi:hypothetical protein
MNGFADQANRSGLVPWQKQSNYLLAVACINHNKGSYYLSAAQYPLGTLCLLCVDCLKTKMTLSDENTQKSKLIAKQNG